MSIEPSTSDIMPRATALAEDPIHSVIVGGPNNEYTFKANPKSFADAKMDCQKSGQSIVTIETLLKNVDANAVCLDYRG